MTICERLYTEMERRGLTAYGLSKKLGVNTTTTSNWKQRGTDPPAKYIVPICEYLGCSIEYLLTGEDAEKVPCHDAAPDMTEDEREMLTLFRRLPERERLLLLGRLQEMAHPLLGGK